MANKTIVGGVVLAALMLYPVEALGQLVGGNATGNPQASWNTANSGTMSQRAPGRIVAAARAQYLDRHRASLGRARSGPTITEMPDLTPSLGQQVQLDLVQEFFKFLNDLFLKLFTGQIGSTEGGASDSPGDTVSTPDTA